MKDNKKELKSMFCGNEELGKAVITEVEKIKHSIDTISTMLSNELSIEENKKMMRALAESYGELVAGVVIPIHFKYPSLD